MTLYLKYRPKTLNDLDLTQVREELTNIAKSGQVPHALLFSGPRGLGKTSAARIIAKIVNCENLGKDGEPCNKCASCLAIDSGNHMDVFELDAASHRGIDDVRSLREGVKLAPAQGRKKVYIIDEAHMLTVEAANALLKTLEEPPEHVMFILATTNPEKIIDTVRSRAVNIAFARPTPDEFIRSLSRVVAGEGLKPEDGFLEALAELSEGSFRDAVKKLDALTLSGKALTVSALEGVSGGREVDELASFIFAKDAKGALGLIRGVDESGETDVLVEKVIQKMRQAILGTYGVGNGNIANVEADEVISFLSLLLDNLGKFSAVGGSVIPLELAIAKWCGVGTRQDEKKEGAKKAPELGKKKLNSNGDASSRERVEPKVEVAPVALANLEDDVWTKVLAEARPRNKSVEALLCSAKPISFDGNVLTIGVYYSFHKERLEAPTYRAIMDEIASSVFGKNIKVSCIVTKPPVQEVVRTKVDEGVVLAEPAGANPSLTTEAGKDIIKLAEEMFSN